MIYKNENTDLELKMCLFESLEKLNEYNILDSYKLTTKFLSHYLIEDSTRDLATLTLSKILYAIGDYNNSKLTLNSNLNIWKDYLFPAQEKIYIYIINDKVLKFHFMSDNIKQNYKFIRKYINNVLYLDDIFKDIKFDKYIDIYVYPKNNDSMGNLLSYADKLLTSIHVNFSITGAHELVHLYFHKFMNHVKIPRFIDEGIATLFDCKDDTWFKYVYINNKFSINSEVMIKIIENKPIGSSLYFYYVSGLLVKYLLYLKGMNNFKEFCFNIDHNDILANIQKLYGYNFIEDFLSFYMRWIEEID